ncbi:4-hydroxybenzoate polyprenyltransferase [Helicobacter monodelphidis]|uniref:menaquinone biosynthesis prenyltransferase MqnP n=1 Tax=Helicobacter sp. 15-1451 TaxID=2004995 RepID=UPI000DCD50B9|nr:menaquinone biosynthesis prenyltransferase MqnP [Helicobacter sp. 15-1451]RAX58019.1 4-hydroxybenzoate polyprenyltransferase [Helicobacter sp. 15-1451]
MVESRNQGVFDTFKKTLKDFNELVAFEHTIFSLPFIIIAMITASYSVEEGMQWFGWRLFILGILAAMSARNFAMAFNRYCDRDIDIKNPRTKNRPSVDGRVNSFKILVFICLNALAFIGIAYCINFLAFILSFPILGILALYSYMKRFSSLAHLVLGLSLGLAPIAGVVAIDEAIPYWAIFLSLGVIFWVAGFDILYSLQDVEFDKKENLHSIPTKFGVKGAINISRFFHVCTIIFWSIFLYSSPLGGIAYLAVVLSAAMLAYEHILVARDFCHIPKAFFVVNGYLGIAFLVILIMDVML